MNPSERCEAQFDDGFKERVKKIQGFFRYGLHRAQEIAAGMDDDDLAAWLVLRTKPGLTTDEFRALQTDIAAFKHPDERPPEPVESGPRDQRPSYDQPYTEHEREPPATPEEAAEFRQRLKEAARGIGKWRRERGA